MLRHLLLLALFTASVVSQAAAQSVVFVVRHGERADAGATAMADDPDLSDIGRARAESLAAMLKDAGITAIFATQYKRTHQTAAPLAKALGLAVGTVHSDDISGLAAQVRKVTGNVLVVSHSGSVPKFLKELGATNVPELGDDDYDNLFIVTTGTPPSVVRLHFR
jgi:broad specificity phosphatase PhoE